MLSLTFLGTGAATPTIDRNVAGLALQREGETILFDCGEGNQRQMMRYGVGFSFTEIFFTHYHADHILGVTGLLRTMGLQDRTAPVTLYGPRNARRILTAVIAL
ncbi:MAG: MBL fold metallo-hydrolase, partial [Gemmatimonadales bacterium]|nr:MBL fold metallo-hydrolase [Gemmatimonadales bacterium]